MKVGRLIGNDSANDHVEKWRGGEKQTDADLKMSFKFNF